jgi:hypothetical protein
VAIPEPERKRRLFMFSDPKRGLVQPDQGRAGSHR